MYKRQFPYNTPASKEAYLYREIFEELFPVPSAAECVPGGPSVACSSAKAIEWDESFKAMNDPSGRAVGVHQSAYKKEVDARRPNTHNAPRNADKVTRKKRWLRSSVG